MAGRLDLVRRALPSIAVAAAAVTIWVRASHPSFYYLENIFALATFWLVAPALFAVGLALQPRRTNPGGRRGWWIAAGVLVFTTGSVIARVPLRASFLFARPELQRLVDERAGDPDWTLDANTTAGPFVISAERSNARQAWTRDEPRCGTRVRVVFVLADDPESAFIYDPGGIEDLCYNSGSKGHLMGPWHSMKED